MLQNVVRVLTTAIFSGEVDTRIYESHKRMVELITNLNAEAWPNISTAPTHVILTRL